MRSGRQARSAKASEMLPLRCQELELLGNAALESSEALHQRGGKVLVRASGLRQVVAEQYFEVRSWQEYFQDLSVYSKQSSMQRIAA